MNPDGGTDGRSVLVCGLDCAEPSLVFECWRDRLPNLARLMDGGTYGRLRSCIPAITVPAWAVMMSGRDPGELGIYGFRNRVDTSYDGLAVADSTSLRAPMIWDLLTKAGRPSISVGVPPSYPPSPVDGVQVSGFLAPETTSVVTSPPQVAEEIRDVAGGYRTDVDGFRSAEHDRILREAREMTDARFDAVRHLLDSRPWDLAAFVEIGLDRIQHAFWAHHDPDHPQHVPDSPYAHAIRDYYEHLDRHVGDLLAGLDDDTVVLVVSDHGAQRMEGGVCINEWLRQEGYLALEDEPDDPTPLGDVLVDWSRTQAWGTGGYYGRVFLNVEGREPEGIVAPDEVEDLRDDLALGIEAMRGPDGTRLQNRAYRPERIYRTVRGRPPDLMVYFDDMAWRSLGSVGHGTVFTRENDRGPDGANHAPDGLFVHHDPRRDGRGEVAPVDIQDVAPTLLRTLGVETPPDLTGEVPPALAP